MLTATHQLENGVLRGKLKGVMDETVDLARLLGTGFKELEINAREVNRINSLGVKIWRNYFHKLRCDGVKVRFLELSPELVLQLNYLSDFIEKNEIVSLCAPYHCAGCGSQTLLTVLVASIPKGQTPQVSPIPCQNCQKPAEFDEIPEEYFNFLEG